MEELTEFDLNKKGDRKTLIARQDKFSARKKVKISAKSEKRKKQKEATTKAKAYTMMLEHIDPKLQKIYAHVEYGEPLELWNCFTNEYTKKQESKALAVRDTIQNM
jgi:hypothetical protein